MALATTHDDSLSIPIGLQPPFPASVGFSNLLIIIPVDLSNVNFSSRVNSYTNKNLDQISSDYNQTAEDMASTYFAQRPAPSKVYVAYWNAEGNTTESFGTAWADIIQKSDNNWFFVALTERSNDTHQQNASDFIETADKPSVLALQTSDPGIVDPGTTPATGLDNIISSSPERTFGIYHTSNTEYADAAMAGMISPWDADRRSAPFFGTLKDVAQYNPGALPSGASIGTAQNPGHIRSNGFNAVLPFGSATSSLRPGQNVNGRQGKVILTKFWFKDRLQNLVASEIQTAAARGNVIPVGAVGDSKTEGQVRMAKLVERQYELGTKADHFKPDNLDISYPQIQSSDVSNGIIPLDAEMTVEIGGSAVTFDIFFSREAV